MTLIEESHNVSDDGNVLIDPQTIAQMGLAPGDDIIISFLSQDGQANSYSEFMLSSAPLFDSDDWQTLFIPNHLLDEAEISVNADIGIACGKGVLAIYAEGGVDNQDLHDILGALQDASSFLREHDNYTRFSVDNQTE